MQSSILFFILVGIASISAIPFLRDLAAQKGRYIGSAANQGHLNDGETNYTTTLAQQFNIITPENCMKWGTTEPQQGHFNFAQGDSLVQFATSHNQIVRGHNLCWGQSNPGWLTNGQFTPQQLRDILKNHVTAEVNHYKGQKAMYSWDVVNEAVLDGPQGNNTLKHNVWYPAVPDYIDVAFQAAKAADPSIKLFYNDYNSEGMNAKSEAIYNLVKSMQQRGIPIDGVGLQMHVSNSNYPDPNQVSQNIDRLTKLGLEVHITEMDVKLDGGGTDQQKLQKQADVYGSLLKACLAFPNCKSFESWGFTDRYTWLGTSQQPLEFDSNYNPKPCFYALAQALQ